MTEAPLPITRQLEHLFFEMHSTMRDIDGLHADAALDELCKLLQVKSYLEQQGSDAGESAGSTPPARIRRFYRDARQHAGGAFGETIRLSDAALVSAFGRLASYSLAGSPADVKGRAFQQVLGSAARAGMGQYFTPAPVGAFMVEIIRPRITESILDPFCGSAHFLTLALESIARRRPTGEPRLRRFASEKLHGLDKSQRMARVAATELRLCGGDGRNIRCADALGPFGAAVTFEPASFDVVLTNPPFGSLICAAALSRLGEFDLAAGRRRVPLEVLGLERSIQFLRPGGRLAVILPDGVFCAGACAPVRDWLRRRVKVRAIVSLPPETFVPYGANVQTHILFARKLHPGERPAAAYGVCMMKVEAIGVDAGGRANGRSDLPEAQSYLQSFLQRAGW